MENSPPMGGVHPAGELVGSSPTKASFGRVPSILRGDIYPDTGGKHEKVKRWLKRHPRFHMHFIPTSSSWLNIVEGFFRNLDQKRLKRDAFRSVPQLKKAIMDYIDNHNDDPKPIVWTKAADEILEKVGRARAALKMPQQSASHH